MAHICSYQSNLKYEIATDRFYYETTAYYYKKEVLMNSMVVQKVYEDGEMFERHLRLTSGGGWLVYFAGEKRTESYYYSSIVEEEEPWYRVQAKANVYTNWNYNIRAFENRKPEYKYLMDKIIKVSNSTYDLSLDFIFALIRAWKEHPQQTEYLISQKKIDLALSKRLYLLSANKQRDILKVVKSDKGQYDIPISTILQMLKHKIYNYDEWCDYQVKKRDEIYKYLICQGETELYYQDYLRLCKQCKKNLDDKYWRFPKELRVKHNELLNQVKIEENKTNDEKLQAFVKKLGGSHEMQIDGYTIYIPSSVEDIELQASKLSQCLISCGYDKRMAKGELILVFMRKGDKPIATCQINKAKEKGQFYANEKSRDHCRPTEKMKKAMDEYLTKLKLKGAKRK